jgi:signal peptidase I
VEGVATVQEGTVAGTPERGGQSRPRRFRSVLGRRAVRRVGTAAVLLTALLGTRELVLTPVSVRGVSMEPTVHDGTAFVARWTDPADLHRGQLVVFRDPQGTLALKRVVGVAGDHVAIRDAVLEVDDRPVAEPYVDQSRIDGTYFGPVTVPRGTIFVMGDNRAPSIDSRAYGAVSFDRVVGRVLFTW